MAAEQSEVGTRKAGWAAIVGGILWIVLWNLAGPISSLSTSLSAGLWRLFLGIPLLFLLGAQLAQRSRFGLATTPITIAGFWIVFYSTLGLLVGNLIQIGIDRLPVAQAFGATRYPSWGLAIMVLALAVQPLGLVLMGSTPKQGFSELTRTTLLAFSFGLFSVLTVGFLLSMLSHPASWVLSGLVFMFGGGWTVLGLTLIGDQKAPAKRS